MTKPDIADRDDVWTLIDAFYTRAFADEMLGPVFVEIAKMDLAAHMPVMCDFWETVLFNKRLYRGNAFQPHAVLDAKVTLDDAMFDRWLTLWGVTVDERFSGPIADRAKLQASRIAKSIRHRLSLGILR